MILLHRAVTFLNYLLKAKTSYGIHSPFVFQLATEVLNDKKKYDQYRAIERIRKMNLSDKRVILFRDLGAGSRHKDPFFPVRISRIAGKSLKPPKYGQLFFRLVKYYRPQHLLELGTSLGISTLYMAAANPHAAITTIEGSEAAAGIARENFKIMGAGNIKLLTGDLDEVLLPALRSKKKLDMVFFDGNHRKEPTLRYFRQCLPLSHENSIFIFDDIYWSPEMQEAWKIIKESPEVSLTADLYEVGLVFFRKGIAKQDFMIRF